ncbi:M20 family metallo-hydrolase [uncultured Oxalicibacterium sp.]|uniref:M20 family metallo-hydrolase n=1 Tax=uncultured Oxalicibacterium sp. TaxID=1168540 RepID=UPI0025E2DDA9|nr:M20 family metallo-hydrolase [uncultured Oxalicibacterium sp.]
MNASNTTDSAAERAQDFVNNARLQSSIAALAAFGGRDDGGVSRETLTPIDLAARRHLIDYARSLGCEVMIDDCANLFFRRSGKTEQSPVLTGSHADTQPIGGKLDGAYGVLAGLEVIAALNDAGISTIRPIEVVAWTNEEGSRFGPGTMGSSAFVTPSLLTSYRQSVDKDGIVMGDALDAALKEVPDVPRRAMAEPMDAYVELHIEQGPVLERANAALGVVTGIQSVLWYRVVCTGMAAHAGTTPMNERSDAMAAAVAIASQLYARAEQEAASNMRLTLGRWHVSPNSINTIPGEVEFTIDVRCVDASVLVRFERFLQDLTTQHAWRGRIVFETLFRREPTIFPQDMRDLIDIACTRATQAAQRGLPQHLTSGAFHDAMYLADHCPTGMIFVPSKDGISHNAAEETAPADLTLGVQALAYTIVELANR